MKKTNNNMTRFFATFLLISFFATTGLARQQSPCKTTLEESELLYDRDLFQTAIDSLENCLPDGFAEENLKVRAYKLMALSHVALNRGNDARKAIDALLVIKPDYNSDRENDPKLFIELVDKAKESIRGRDARRKRKKRLVWGLSTTGVVISGGVIAYFLLKPPPLLPDPPGDPEIPN